MGQNSHDANEKSEALHQRCSPIWYSQSKLASSLEQLDRIAVGIFQLDLLASRTYLQLIPKMQSSLFQHFNSSGQVFDLQNYPIPSTRPLLTTIRHRTRTRSARTTENEFQIADGDLSESRQVLHIQFEAKLFCIEVD